MCYLEVQQEVCGIREGGRAMAGRVGRARARDVTAAVSKEPHERDDAHVSPLLRCECSDVVLVRVVPCVH